MIRLTGALVLVWLAACISASGADAGYCEDQFGTRGSGGYDVRGACRETERFLIDGPVQPTRVTLWLDRNVMLTDATLRAIVTAILETADRAGPRLRDLGARLHLPERVNIVVITAPHPSDGSSNAETFRISAQSATDPTRQCPILLFRSVHNLAALRRTLSHELFHCVQYNVLQSQSTAENAGWWMEGSAEWFEDYAFPEDYAHSNTGDAVQRFHELGTYRPLYTLSNGAVVFFSWLQQRRGVEAIARYLSNTARPGQPQPEAMRRALAPAEYHRFAQAYVDDEIRLPNGTVIDGGRLMPSLGTTTGEPRADPDIERATPISFTVQKGTVEIVPGEYQPKGTLGAETKIFSERRGEWKALPEALKIECGERKQYRFAAMPTEDRPPAFKLKPGTQKAVNCGECGATGGTVRRAGCVVGSWRLVPGTGGNCDWMGNLAAGGTAITTQRCDPGEAVVSFNRDGTFAGMLTNARRAVRMSFPAGRRGGPSPTMTAENVIALAKSTGLWKATEETGNLKLCSTATAGTGKMVMHGSDPLSGESRDVTQPMRFGPLEMIEFEYSCSGDSMSVTYTPRGLPGFSYRLERTGPPAGDTPPPAR